MSAAAGVSKSIFISSKGFGYWCGEGMGQLKNVSLHLSTYNVIVNQWLLCNVSDGSMCIAASILSPSPLQHIATLPTVIRLPEPLHSASIGNSHTVLVMRSGRMMSVGSNGRHQTGVPTQDNRPINSYTYIETPSS